MFKLEPRTQTSMALAVAAPLLALAITVLIGIVLFTALGKDPLQALRLFFVEPLKNGRALSELSVKAVPLALIALGLAVCFRANIWNIGAEGQFVLGALGAGWVAMQAGPDTSAWFVVPVLLGGMVGGMLWAGVVALLRDRFNTNEILVSLMLVYVATLLLNYLVYGPWKDPEGYNFPQTVLFAAATRLPRLVPGLRMNAGVVIALLAVVAFAVFQFRTYRGYALTVGGIAPAAARYAVAQCAVDGAAAVRRHGRPGGCFRGGRAAGAAHALRAGGLRLRGHHRRLRRSAAPGRHRVLVGADEHVLHRRRAGAEPPGPAQGADQRVPGAVAVHAAGL
jgi:simple sugar transport system permease protein